MKNILMWASVPSGAWLDRSFWFFAQTISEDEWVMIKWAVVDPEMRHAKSRRSRNVSYGQEIS